VAAGDAAGELRAVLEVETEHAVAISDEETADGLGGDASTSHIQVPNMLEYEIRNKE
jgi:hypothetical protein